MEQHRLLSNTEFEQQFKSCVLNPAVFTHEAHLRLTWLYINQYGMEYAENTIPVQLKNYVAFLGASDKYHTTLTLSAIKAVYHFMLKSKASNFNDFILEFPRLKTHFKELMASHYKTDIFNSTKAKLEYLAPDLLPFD